MNLSEEELPKALQKHAEEENVNINNNNNIRNTRKINIGIFIIWTIFRI